MAPVSADMQLNQFVPNTILGEMEARATERRLYSSEREEICVAANLNRCSVKQDNCNSHKLNISRLFIRWKLCNYTHVNRDTGVACFSLSIMS